MPELQQRHNAGKPQLSYILSFPHAITDLARVCEYGASKYAAYNYKKGCPFSQATDCLLRHLTAFHNAEDLDHESKQTHLGHVIFNALQLSEMYHTRPELDDRPHTHLEKSDGEGEPPR